MFTPAKYREKAAGYGKLMKATNNPDERRELQELEQSFNLLADNEQWLADNHDKVACAVISDIDGSLAHDEEHVLRCLGAALILQWNTLPQKLRRELFDDAGTMGELLKTVELRGKLARFLHKHKNDEGAAGGSIRTGKNELSPYPAAIERWENEGGASSHA